MSDLISRSEVCRMCGAKIDDEYNLCSDECLIFSGNVPSVNAYTAHEVAEIIAEILGDPCACNFNGIDEWLPFKCELLDACPHTEGVACWEQYLKFKGERKEP